MGTKSKIILIVTMFLILVPIIVFASSQIIKIKILDDNASNKDTYIENVTPYNEEEARRILETPRVLSEEDKKQEERINELNKQFTENNNKVLEIAKKYYPDDMEQLYEKLGNKSIYETNTELEYYFDEIILKILDTKDVSKEEKQLLVEYLNNEYGNVRDNPELMKKIEKYYYYKD